MGCTLGAARPLMAVGWWTAVMAPSVPGWEGGDSAYEMLEHLSISASISTMGGHWGRMGLLRATGAMRSTHHSPLKDSAPACLASSCCWLQVLQSLAFKDWLVATKVHPTHQPINSPPLSDSAASDARHPAFGFGCFRRWLLAT